MSEEDNVDEIIDELEALANEYSREDVMEAIHILSFGNKQWSEADGIGYRRVSEGEVRE